MAPDAQINLRQYLSTYPGHIYALLDAAREPAIPRLLKKHKIEHHCLYQGKEAEELALWAPYLAQVPIQSPLFDILLKKGWGESWGYFCLSTDDLKTICDHFRHFIRVQLPNDDTVFFRFYDPRVLRIYWPTCTPKEQAQFCGPIAFFLTEDEDPDYLLSWSQKRHEAERKYIARLPKAPSAQTEWEAGQSIGNH